ncbi:MAG: hypothetical protein AAF664_26210 [Planctomycetota bacterium]
MFSDILAGVKTLATIFNGASKLRQDQTDKVTQDVFVDLHVNATRLLKAGRLCVTRGRDAVEDFNYGSLRNFALQYVRFRDIFERLGHNPDWDATEYASVFDVLNIYVPDFINNYFKALRDSGEFFVMQPVIRLHQFLNDEEYRIINRKELHISYDFEPDEVFYSRLDVGTLSKTASRLAEFVDEIEASLPDLEKSIEHLGAFIRDRYSITNVYNYLEKRAKSQP